MKILGAAAAVPAPATTAQSCANDYAIKAARQALQQAGCLPSELDLIVSLSISPSRMADAPSIAGPRLAQLNALSGLTSAGLPSYSGRSPPKWSGRRYGGSSSPTTASGNSCPRPPTRQRSTQTDCHSSARSASSAGR